MATNTEPAEKSIVSQLKFDTKTAKRVAWSEWEFTIVAPFEIEVCNASYGYKKEDHTYRVFINEEGVPVSCTCPGFQHYHGPNGKVGKHMLAVATIGGPTLLDAAAAFPAQTDTPASETTVVTVADRLTTDGGTPDPEPEAEDEDESGPCPNGDPRCEGSDGDSLCCFGCYWPTDDEVE